MKFSTYPSFRAMLTVSVWLTSNQPSVQPDARLRVTCYLNHRDDLSQGSRNAAEFNLQRLGVPEDKLKGAYYEYEVDGFVAVEPRGVRNPDREPVEAFSPYHVVEVGNKKKTTLIKQRRLVPDDQKEMIEWYATPARKAELAAPQAVAA